ncbi:MAG: SpoVR family protein [Candidatus Riflebacteria bacterium]|nr:SpoVR family protein [Candidatus Riflebacteria bacterium]
MEILSHHQKKIMEDCKKIARDMGLSFRDETIEFIITNEDMIRLSPKAMIPTLYDYWVNDVYVLQDKGKYDIYPHNPYETVINTRPPVSFYNDNNPDWLNVMIFYHVIGHIDFFQNNVFFRKTWLDDFLGRALSDAQTIKELRLEHGRWVDYVIEFSRGIDNVINYHGNLFFDDSMNLETAVQSKFNFFFDEYLQNILNVTTFRYIEELDKFNEFSLKSDPENAKSLFLMYVGQKYLDFNVTYEKRTKNRLRPPGDVIEYLMRFSEKLNKEENDWMKTVMQIVRDTSMYFQPQIRTKILNEGWASYWHEILYMNDSRCRGHEVEFSKVNAGVVSLSRVGLNPYAIGLRLFKYLEAKADRGMISYDYEKLLDIDARQKFDTKQSNGRDYIFSVRKYHSDSTAINQFIDQDFVDEFKLFVVGKRLNPQKQVWEYYIKSKKAEDYKNKMSESLYHPPHITVDTDRTQTDGALYMVHTFEGKELVREYIANTMLGIEFLWGKKVILETHELDDSQFRNVQTENTAGQAPVQQPAVELKFQKIRYVMENRKLSREIIA